VPPAEDRTSVLPAAAARTEPEPEPVSVAEPVPDQDEDTEPQQEPRRRAKRGPRRLPQLPQGVAVLVTGIVTGLVGVALAYLTIRGCEVVRGVGSCGGVGLLALLVVLAAEVVVGAILLKAWGITDPTSTAFLGVGVVAVLAMLFFLGSIDSLWMLLVIPGLTALAFVLSTWVTRSFDEAAENVRANAPSARR
jgi:hypothetical protein